MNGDYLRGKRCYLSGPIEYSDIGINWRDAPTEILTKRYGIDLFDPFADPKQQWVPTLMKAKEDKNYDEMRRIAKSFVKKDLSMVTHSHLLVAYLPYKVPTTGTHHEIISASDLKKPTLLVCPQGKHNVPLWYYGFIPHNNMFGSFEELYARLDEINNGLHKDNDRWSLVYGLI